MPDESTPAWIEDQGCFGWATTGERMEGLAPHTLKSREGTLYR